MKLLFTILITLTTTLLASEVQNYKWGSGDTYLTFLENYSLPTKELYYDLDKEDKIATEDIMRGVNYQLLVDDTSKVLQALIPLNDELQIHIYSKDDDYFFQTIPIISETKVDSFTIKLANSPYQDIVDQTGSLKLASIFVAAFENTINFRREIKKGDTLAMVYEQKYRLGREFSMPTLYVAMVETNGKPNYIYQNEDGIYYNERGEIAKNFLLSTPIQNARISSYFNKGRFHPILKKYRAHQGVDYAAPTGTPIKASGDGRVTFVGFSKGYGNTIKVKHASNYLTLYAHMKSFKKGLRSGSYVKKGDVIGYVGSTGLATGPHLHFGLYSGGTAIDPLKVVEVAKKEMSKKEKEAFNKIKNLYNGYIQSTLTNEALFIDTASMERECYFSFLDTPKT
ncbi:MAG: peptidoglycan DD-metalloendopeptidase family protein [Sulfuricurvum sp.]